MADYKGPRRIDSLDRPSVNIQYHRNKKKILNNSLENSILGLNVNLVELFIKMFLQLQSDSFLDECFDNFQITHNRSI